MKRLKGPLFGIALLSLIVWLCNILGDKRSKLSEYIKGSVYLRGQIVSTKVSNNHLFGIVQIKVDSAHMGYSLIAEKDRSFLPFRQHGDTAEIYKKVDAADSIGYELTLESTADNITVRDKMGRVAYMSRPLMIADDFADLDFVCRMTVLHPCDLCVGQ